MLRPLYGKSPNFWNADALESHVRGIIAVLLSLRKKPVIRYERMSAMAKTLGTEIQVHLHCISTVSPLINGM